MVVYIPNEDAKGCINNKFWGLLKLVVENIREIIIIEGYFKSRICTKDEITAGWIDEKRYKYYSDAYPVVAEINKDKRYPKVTDII